MISKHQSRRLVLSASAALLCLAANVAQAQQNSANMPAMSASAASMPGKGGDAFSQSMMNGMQKMQAMKPSGDTDKDFAMMMRMHHQQALDMAQIELSRGRSGEMKAMAERSSLRRKRRSPSSTVGSRSTLDAMTHRGAPVDALIASSQ